MSRTGKAPVSGNIQCYDWTWFRCLNVGDKFFLQSEVEGWGKVGICEKLSVRKYRHKDVNGNDVDVTIGSIKAVIIKSDDNGRPCKLRDYVPNLGD